MPAPHRALPTSSPAQKCGMTMSVTTQIIFPYMSDAHAPAMDVQMTAQDAGMPRSFRSILSAILTLSSTDCDLLGASSASARAVGAVRGRRSPARHQLNLPLGRAITRHQCSLPQRVQLPGRPAGSCLLLAERRRRCPAQGVGGQLWLEDGGCFEAAAARVSFRGYQHAARSPIPCLGRRLPVTCSSSRRVLTPW
jgi:hypothetical protein